MLQCLPKEIVVDVSQLGVLLDYSYVTSVSRLDMGFSQPNTSLRFFKHLHGLTD